jgi:hypothetical protein
MDFLAMIDPGFCVAVFPFLKTASPVKIGGYAFRSTSDLEGLPSYEAEAVREIAQMLFVQDDLRVKSASYAILPDIQVHSADPRLTYFADLRAVMAYFYSAPHEVFDTVFLNPEEVSLILFTPGRVSTFLTRPEHHTERDAPHPGPSPDPHHYVPGYNGLYNFRHAFWVEPGSRVYGPKPNVALVIAQDLESDITQWVQSRRHDHLLLELLEKSSTATSRRIFAAIRWYNNANASGLDQSGALLNLAVAFETLLRLPETYKKERLVDAISLLLGRTDRLDDWADQFYAARSRVAHEGQVRDGHFYASSSTKQRQVTDIFGSLMLYGRHIFQLCVGTVLVGIDLAERAELQDKLTTNNERYGSICRTLEDKSETPSDRLLKVASIVSVIERYQFVVSAISAGTAIAAVRLATTTLAACGQDLPEELGSAMAACADTKRRDGELRELEAIEQLYNAFDRVGEQPLSPEARVARDITRLVWMSLFQRHYWLKEQRQAKQPG